jgi:hypothetical protein
MESIFFEEFHGPLLRAFRIGRTAGRTGRTGRTEKSIGKKKEEGGERERREE